MRYSRFIIYFYFSRFGISHFSKEPAAAAREAWGFVSGRCSDLFESAQIPPFQISRSHSFPFSAIHFTWKNWHSCEFSLTVILQATLTRYWSWCGQCQCRCRCQRHCQKSESEREALLSRLSSPPSASIAGANTESAGKTLSGVWSGGLTLHYIEGTGRWGREIEQTSTNKWVNKWEAARC